MSYKLEEFLANRKLLKGHCAGSRRLAPKEIKSIFEETPEQHMNRYAHDNRNIYQSMADDPGSRVPGFK